MAKDEESVKGKPCASDKNHIKNLWWIFAICLGAAGMFGGWMFYQNQKLHSEEDAKNIKKFGDEKTELDTKLGSAQKALKACEAKSVQTVPCEANKKHMLKKHLYRAPSPPASVPRAEKKIHRGSILAKPTAAQIAEACSPLPIISDGQGGWKCIQMSSQKVEVVKETIKPKEPEVYYPAVDIDGSNEESSLPTSGHLLGCAGIGAVGGLVAEDNRRGILRGAAAAVLGDLVGTALGGRAGGDIGCGVGVAGNMAYRYHNKNRGGSNPAPVVISQPPVAVSQPPTFTTSPSIVFSGPPGVSSLPPSFPR